MEGVEVVVSVSRNQPEPQHAEPFAPGTVLTDVMGVHPKTRILAVLLADPERDLNPTDIARLAGIDRTTFYNHIDDLRAYGVVETTRTVGVSTMYQLRKNSEATGRLAGFEWALIEYLAAKEQAGELDDDGRPVLPDED